MKILYFHQHFNTPQGAVGIRSFAMARALIAAGHDVTMVCGRYIGGNTGLYGEFINGRREGNVNGIHVIEIDLPYSNSVSFVKRTLVFVKFAMRSITIAMLRDYDLIFATSTPLTAGIPGIFARWLRRKTFVFEVRDLWPELPQAMGAITNPLVLKIMSILEFISYRSAHHCIALAPGIFEGIAKRGVSKDRISLIPNGCDINLFQSAKPMRPNTVKDSDLLAIYCGTHGVANGLDNVLHVAEMLKTRGRDDIKFVFIGAGGKKAEIISKSRTLNLDNMIFLDAMPKTLLANYLAGADVGLQVLANVPAFYYGTSPNKFFDYLSASKPILTNYPGWVAELVEENDCGWVVPADDPIGFADALEEAQKIRDRLPTLGLSAVALARREFDREVLAQSFITVLEKTLET